MAKILGLDLGATSIGWALFDTEKVMLLDAGSHIFPVGLKEDDYAKSGKEISKNKSRREARGARRRYYRFKMRRERLKKVLNEMGFMPDQSWYTQKPGDNGNLAISLYRLRKEALEKPLSPGEIGRIFLHINHHRGFKSNKKELSTIDTNENKKKEIGIVQEFADKLREQIRNAKEMGFIDHSTVGAYFYHLIEQNKNSYNPSEPITRIHGKNHHVLREMYLEEFDTIWDFQKKYHSIMNDSFKAKVRDECIFFQRDLRSQKHLRNRCKYEYTEYFDEQKNQIIRSYLPCCPRSSFEFQEYRIWDQVNNLRYIDTEDNLCELTPLQKSTIVDFLNKNASLKVTGLKKLLELPKATQFKDYNDLKGNITLIRLKSALGDKYWDDIGIPQDSDNEPMKYSTAQMQLWHTLEFSSSFSFSDLWLKGDSKYVKRWKHSIQKLKLTPTQLNEYSKIVLESDYSSLSLKAIRKLLPWMKQGYDLRAAEKAAGYTDLSNIRNNDDNLLNRVPPIKNNELKNPIVQQGVAETIRLINAIIEDPNLGKPDIVRIEMARELRKPKTIREEIRSSQNTIKDRRKKYADFLTEKLNRQIDPGNSIITKFELYLELEFSIESFDKISGEIDLKKFKEFSKKVDHNDAKKFKLWMECDRILPYTGKQINLTKLFSSEIEIEHIIPYSRCEDNSFANKTLSDKEFNLKKGNMTPLEYFSSRSDEEVRAFKIRISKLPEGKQIRFLMKNEDLDDFRKNMLNNTAYIAKKISEHFRTVFKADSIQMTTGHATSFIRKCLGFDSILNPSFTVSESYEYGKYWAVFDEYDGLIDLYPKKDDTEPQFGKNQKILSGRIDKGRFFPDKPRSDHRHHAVDAVVISLIDSRINHLLSEFGKSDDFDEFGNIKKEIVKKIKLELKKNLKLGELWYLKENIKPIIDKIFVSYKHDGKIDASGKKAIYKSNGKRLTLNYRNNEIKPYSGGDVARGPIHNKSLYGKIRLPETGEERFVDRVFLIYQKSGYFSKMDQIDKIVDKHIKEIIYNRVKEIGGNPETALKKVLEEGVFLENLPKRSDSSSTVRKPVQVKTVRITTEDKNLPSIRESHYNGKKAFVAPGENAVVALYGSMVLEKNEKRDFLTISLLDAAKIKARNRKLRKKGLPTEPLFPSIKNGKKLLTYLSKKDMFVVYSDHPEEINWNDERDLFRRLFYVIKADKNGAIILGRHFRAGIKADKDASVQNLNSLSGNVIRCLPNTFNAIKVRISITGKLIRFSNA